MTYIDRHIIEAYSGLFEGLSSTNKTELIQSLSKSLKVEKKISEDAFYKSFGAFALGKSAEKIISEIKMENWFKCK